MQILSAIFLNFPSASLHRLPHSFPILVVWRVADSAGLFYSTPQPTTLNVLRQYTLHVPPTQAPDVALAGTAVPMRNPFSFSQNPTTLDRDRIVVPAGGAFGERPRY